MKYAVHFIFLLFILCLPAQAATDEVSLTSDTMQYNIGAGLFYAEGNVTIKTRGIVIIATLASGHMNNKSFNLSGNITINGTWNGDDVNFAAVSATVEIGDQIVYTLESGISGRFGKVAIDCEYLQMVGNDITAKNVRRFQDQKAGFTFTAANMKGKIDNGELIQAEAEGNIVIQGTPGKGGDVVELKGKKAIYSINRGTIVVSGGVSAKQNKRTLIADSVVYFPVTNRIEAIGKPRITVNVEDENMSSISLPKNKK